MKSLKIKDIEWDIREINLHPIEMNLEIKDPFGDLNLEDEEQQDLEWKNLLTNILIII